MSCVIYKVIVEVVSGGTIADGALLPFRSQSHRRWHGPIPATTGAVLAQADSRNG